MGIEARHTIETRPRYTPTTCFETFPFPRPTTEQEAAIAAAAKELNELRERWLNPPEWTAHVWNFPAPPTARGRVMWMQRHVDASRRDMRVESKRRHVAHSKIGLARYPRLEPRDADCAAKLKDRTLTKLYNERPAWLDLAHKKLDAAVAAAYGCPPPGSDG